MESGRVTPDDERKRNFPDKTSIELVADAWNVVGLSEEGERVLSAHRMNLISSNSWGRDYCLSYGLVKEVPKNPYKQTMTISSALVPYVPEDRNKQRTLTSTLHLRSEISYFYWKWLITPSSISIAS